ncbi:hypothetical protein ASF53_19480 [Methylobacterium sp. Leaf123]|uniref:hypothetical protein n=1 Tax=Methylobacterium sp. Leaf123 TaxID=1736264 RepID=UPI0006F9BA02|nr:hypothetical protein [Methylobacterium sp. Leaf123]KQQ29415.1 hypothetical protein ASF53_19480 [Methylobacterium sp. Leaf123]
MAEQIIARTVAEAQVGDLLWVNVDRWRATPWVLWPVRKVGRLYAHVGPTEGEGGWVRIHRELPRDSNRIIAGWRERELQEWRRLADQIADQVRRCSDVEALKTVAFALGIEGPPDFSVVPSDPHTPASGALKIEEADRG